ncbi:hypothetical protein BDR04DRAFT_1099800, partial [Suillus decipiens]
MYSFNSSSLFILVCRYLQISLFSGFDETVVSAKFALDLRKATNAGKDWFNIQFIAAITVLVANPAQWATIWLPCCNRHNRCRQRNDGGEEREMHCLVEV